MDENFISYDVNPNIDFLLPFYLGEEFVPTKQDSFKPIKVIERDEDGGEKINKNFYIKNDENELLIYFKEKIQNYAKNIFNENNKISKPNKVEVILSITLTEKRFKSVDVDNLAKTILDSLNNIAYEDDSQVSCLIVKKHIHPMKTNSLLIGVTKITDDRKGFGGNIFLFSKST